MTTRILTFLVMAFVAVPQLSFANFPDLKSKDQLLPLLYAAVQDSETVTLGNDTFELSWADEEQAKVLISMMTQANADVDFSSIDFLAFSEALDFIYKLISDQLTSKDMDAVFNIFQKYHPKITKAEFDATLPQLLSESKKALKSLNSHERKTMDFAKNLLGFKNFDYLNKVGEGKVKQRYRIKYYDYEDKKTVNLDFFLKSTAKPKKATAPKAKKEKLITEPVAKDVSSSSTSSTSTTAAPKAKKADKAKKKDKKTKAKKAKKIDTPKTK